MTASSITQPMKSAPRLSSTPTNAPIKAPNQMAGQAPVNDQRINAHRDCGGGPSTAA